MIGNPLISYLFINPTKAFALKGLCSVLNLPPVMHLYVSLDVTGSYRIALHLSMVMIIRYNF